MPPSTGRGSVLGSTLSCPRVLLDKVDEIRKLGLTDIPLPQIAVVGDQSSGKSSLLEYISGIPFPKDSQMCTSFVTEVSMRPASAFSAKVLVNGLVDDSLSKPTSPEEVADLIEDAKRLFTQKKGKKDIYDDILTVELNGPDLPLLTLVDLPGYVHTHSKGQSETIVEDIENLIERYLEGSRTIILAVIPVNRDFETNKAVKHIRKFDQEGKRTLCVLTKPDLIDQGTEDNVLRILSGSKWHLARGYHIIKNKNYEECRLSQPWEITAKNESTFFSSSPWSTIDSNDKGILSLVGKLTDSLSSMVQKEFSTIKKEIVKQKGDLERQLNSLGPSIATDLEKSNFLQHNIHRIMLPLKYLIDGHYSAVQFDKKYYVRARVQKLHHKFYHEIINTTASRIQQLDVESIMEVTRGRGMKEMFQYEPFVILCREVIDYWWSITQNHITNSCKVMSDVSVEVIQIKCDELLLEYFLERMVEYVEKQEAKMTLTAKEFFDNEWLHPFTCRDLNTLAQSESGGSLNSQADSDSNSTSSAYSSRPQPKQVQPPSESAKCQFQQYIEKYFLIAAKRYADMICVHVIESCLFNKFDERIISWFTDHTVALSQVREPTQTSRLREELPSKIDKLTEAIRRL